MSTPPAIINHSLTPNQSGLMVGCSFVNPFFSNQETLSVTHALPKDEMSAIKTTASYREYVLFSISDLSHHELKPSISPPTSRPPLDHASVLGFCLRVSLISAIATFELLTPGGLLMQPAPPSVAAIYSFDVRRSHFITGFSANSLPFASSLIFAHFDLLQRPPAFALKIVAAAHNHLLAVPRRPSNPYL